LNFHELCVLYACSLMGTRAFTAAPQSVIVISLLHKGCVHHMSGVQTAMKMNFGIYNDIYEIVRAHGKERFGEDMTSRYDWEEQVINEFRDATDWRKW